MAQLHALWQQLQGAGLATANIGYLTDMICCPGGDYCSLANAKSLPVAEAIQARFDELDYIYDLGPLELNISGCMNACGHHHIGHIGILGVDKKGQEFYQVCLGGSQSKEASIGKILGPSFKQEDMPEVVDKILTTYLALRRKRRASSRPIDASASTLSRSEYMPRIIKDGRIVDDTWRRLTWTPASRSRDGYATWSNGCN